jgi:hypothetical protein
VKTLTASEALDQFDRLAHTCRQAFSGAQLERHMKQVRIEVMVQALRTQGDPEALARQILALVRPSIEAAPLARGPLDQPMSEIWLHRLENLVIAMLIPMIWLRAVKGIELRPSVLKEVVRQWISQGTVHSSLREAPHGDLEAVTGFINERCERDGLKGADASAAVRYSVIFPVVFALEPLVMLEEKGLLEPQAVAASRDAGAGGEACEPTHRPFTG